MVDSDIARVRSGGNQCLLLQFHRFGTRSLQPHASGREHPSDPVIFGSIARVRRRSSVLASPAAADALRPVAALAGRGHDAGCRHTSRWRHAMASDAIFVVRRMGAGDRSPAQLGSTMSIRSPFRKAGEGLTRCEWAAASVPHRNSAPRSGRAMRVWLLAAHPRRPAPRRRLTGVEYAYKRDQEIQLEKKNIIEKKRRGLAPRRSRRARLTFGRIAPRASRRFRRGLRAVPRSGCRPLP